MPDETNELDFGSQPIMIPKVNRDDETQKLRDMFLRRDESYNEIKEIKRQVQDTNSASNLLGIMKESLRTNQKISTNVSNISTSITSGFNSLKSELQNQYKQQRTQDRIDTDNTKQLISKVDKLNDKIDKIKKQEDITGIVIKPINDLIINIKQINKDIEDLKKVYSNPSKSGGYTGGSNINRPQGIVHEGEYVAPQWLVKQERETIRRLEDIRKGYKVGGYVTKNIPSNARIDQELDKLKQRFSDTISKWTVTTQSRPDKQEIGLQLSILQKSMDKNLPTFEFTPQIQKIIKYLTDNNRITAIPQYEEVFKFKDRLDAVLKNEFSKYVEKTNFNKVGSYDPNKFDQLQQNLVDQIKTTEQFKNLPNKLEMTEDELLNFLQLAFSQSDTSSATPGLFINKLRAINKVTGIHFKPLTSIIENVVALAGRPTDYYGRETPNLFKQQKMLMQGKYEDLSKIQTPEVKAYRWGGYTGKGDPNEIQGVVHKDEVVLSSSMWRSLFSSKPLELLKEILHYTERNQVQNELQLKIDKDRFIIEDKKFRDYLSDRNKQKDERAMGTVEEIQEQQQAKQGASGAGQGFLAGILGAKVQSKVGGVFNITKGQGFIGNVKNVLGSTQGRLLGGVGGQVQLGMDQFSQYGQNTQIDPTTGRSATDWGGTVQGTIQGSKQGGLMNQLSQQGKYQQIGTAIGGPLGTLIGGGIGALVGGLGQDRIKQIGVGIGEFFTGIKVTEEEINKQLEELKKNPKFKNLSDDRLQKMQTDAAKQQKNPIVQTLRKGVKYFFNPFQQQADLLNNQFGIQQEIDSKYDEMRRDPTYKDIKDADLMKMQRESYQREHPILSFFSNVQSGIGGFISGVWSGILGIFGQTKDAKDKINSQIDEVNQQLKLTDFDISMPNLDTEIKGKIATQKSQWNTGGYTGNVQKDEIQGVVHGGEYVIPQDLLPKYKNTIESIEQDRVRNLKGYIVGGIVDSPVKKPIIDLNTWSTANSNIATTEPNIESNKAKYWIIDLDSISYVDQKDKWHNNTVINLLKDDLKFNIAGRMFGNKNTVNEYIVGGVVDDPSPKTGTTIHAAIDEHKSKDTFVIPPQFFYIALAYDKYGTNIYDGKDDIIRTIQLAPSQLKHSADIQLSLKRQLVENLFENDILGSILDPTVTPEGTYFPVINTTSGMSSSFYISQYDGIFSSGGNKFNLSGYSTEIPSPRSFNETFVNISQQQFSKGGYTGNVQKDEIQGVVHGGEYVIPQDLLPKYKNTIESIEQDRVRKLKGYQDGGFVLTPDKPYFYGEIRNMLNAIPTSDNIDLKYTINDALTDIQNQLDDSRFISYENLKSILSFYNLLQTEEPPTSEWYLKEFTKAPEVEHNMLKESIQFFKNKIQKNQIQLMESENLPGISGDLLNQLTGGITEQSLQPLFDFIDKATKELPEGIINKQQEKIEYKIMTQLQKDSWSNLLTYTPKNISNISNLLTYYTGGVLSNLENLGANELLPILNSDAFNFMKDVDRFANSDQFKNLNISQEVQAYYIDDLLPDGPVKQILDSKYLYNHFTTNKTISLDQFSRYINAQTSDVEFETWKKGKAIDKYATQYQVQKKYEGEGILNQQQVLIDRDYYPITEQYEVVKSDYVPEYLKPSVLSKLGLAKTNGKAVEYAEEFYIPKKTLNDMIIEQKIENAIPMLKEKDRYLPESISLEEQRSEFELSQNDQINLLESDLVPSYIEDDLISKLYQHFNVDKNDRIQLKHFNQLVSESIIDFTQRKKIIEATQMQGLQTKDAYLLSRKTLSPALLNKYDDITNNQFYDIFGNILDKKGLVGYSEAFRVLNNIENFREYFSELGLDLTPEILQNKNLLSKAYPSFNKILQDPSSMVDIRPDDFEHLYLLDLVKDNPQFTKAMLNEDIANKLLDKVISTEPNSLANKSLRQAISDYFDVNKFITLDKLKEMVDEDREERRYIPLIPDSVVDLIHPNSLQLAVQLQKQGGLTYSLLDSQNTVDFQPISGIQGFYTGGFTPDIGTDKIAGVVHGGEYVVPQNLVDKYRPELNAIEKDRLQNLPGYQEGGDVVPSILRMDITSSEFIENLVQNLSSELSTHIQNMLGIPEFTQDYLNSLVEDLKLSSIPNINQVNTLRNIVSTIIKEDTIYQDETKRDDLAIWLAGQIKGAPEITTSIFSDVIQAREILDTIKKYEISNPQKYWKLDQLNIRNVENDQIKKGFNDWARELMDFNLTLDMYYKGESPFHAPGLGNLSASFVYDRIGDGIFTPDTDFIRTISLDPDSIASIKSKTIASLTPEELDILAKQEFALQEQFVRMRDMIFQDPSLLSQLLDADPNSAISVNNNKQLLADIVHQEGLPSLFISNVTGNYINKLLGKSSFAITGTPYNRIISKPAKFREKFGNLRFYNIMKSLDETQKQQVEEMEKDVLSGVSLSSGLDFGTLYQVESDNYYSSFSKNQMQSELRQLFNEYDKIYPKMYSNKDWTLEQEIVTSWYRDKIQGRNISKYLVGNTIEEDLKYYQEKQIATREKQAQYENEDPKKYLGEYNRDTLNLIIDRINNKIVSQENIISTLPENQELFTEGQTLNIPGQFNNPDLLHQGLSEYYDKLVKEKKLQYYGGLLNINDSKYANSPQYQWWMHKLLLSEESVPDAHDALSVRTRDLLTQYLRENFGVQTLSGDYINQLTERPYLNGPNTLQAAFGIYWPDKKLKLDTSNLSNKTITNQNEIQEAVRSGEIPFDRLQELPEEVKMQTIERQKLEIDVFKQLFNPIQGKETDQLVAMLDSYTTPEDANNFLKSLQYIVNHSTIGGNYRISEDYDLPRIQGLLHNEKYGQGYEEYLNTDITLDEIIRQNKDNIITYFKKSDISNKDDMIDYIQKYKVGGYTGEGNQNEIQGFVHKGEYVIPKNIVDSNPLLIDELETMRLRQEDVESLTRNANQSLQDLQEREEPNNPLISNVEVLHRDNQKTVEILTRILEAIANNKPIEIPSEFNVKGIQDLIQTIKNSNTPPINIISPVTNTANSFSNNYGGGLRSQIPMRVPLQ